MTPVSVQSLQRKLQLHGKPCRLDYHLLENSIADETVRRSFDIEIVLTDEISGSCERCKLPGLTTDESLAVRWLYLLADGMVTPAAAYEIMDDLLAQL